MTSTAASGKQKQLSSRSLSANSRGLMLKRRLNDAGLPPIFSPHSFRVLVVTDLLSQEVPFEDYSTWPATPIPGSPRSMTGADG